MNLRKFFGALSLFCMVGLIPLQTLAQQKLLYKLKPGDIFKVKQNAKQHIYQDIDGYKQEVINDLDAIFSFEVVEENETSYTLKLAFEDFGMKISSPTLGKELLKIRASEPNAENPQSLMFNGLLDFPMVMVMRKDGKVLEVNGGDGLIDNMIQKGNITNESNKALMKQSLSTDFSSKVLAQSFEQMTYFYPENPVSIGSTWNNLFEGKLNAENTWTLDSISMERMDISSTANIRMNTETNGTTMALNGTQKTSITANATNGFIMTIISESSVEGISKVPSLPDTEIPTSIKSTITYELIQ